MAPKRAASTSIPRMSSTSDGPNANATAGPSKRTRFASPNNAGFTENGDNDRAAMAQFEEQVDASLEDGLTTRSRRTQVKVDGYESDSTDDGEGVVESRKKGNKEGEDGDDDLDMFAPDDKVDKDEDDAYLKKKKTEYLKLGDIEGQEFEDDDGEDEGLSEVEPEDEDDAERRKKAGMGYEISSFNMREEMEEGKFDADGTFVRAHDPHGIHDRWMEGLDEKEIKKARRNKKLREREERKREEKEEKEKMSKGEAERELVSYLKKSETMLEALQRLGAAAKKYKSSHPNHPTKYVIFYLCITSSRSKPLRQKNNSGMDVDQPSSSPIQDAINRITTLGSILMSHGNIDIYSWTYEQLLRSVRAAGDVGPDWIPQSHDAIYEYKWAAIDDSVGAENQSNPQVYGPYKEEELLSWYDADYFGDAGEKIRVRRIRENEWRSWDEVIF